MTGKVEQFINDENAAVAIEYALIAVIVSTAIYGSVATIAPQLIAIFTKVTTSLSSSLAK